MSQDSLYAKLGGEATIDKVVEVFYQKVLADPTVNGFFEHTDMEKQKRHQAAFIGFALGSGRDYSGKSMAKAHEGMNLQPEHFGAIAGHLQSTLQELGVGAADIDTVLTKIASLKDDILYK